MKVKFLALTKAKVELVGDDENFDLLRNIIYQHIKEKNKDKMKMKFRCSKKKLNNC